MIDSILDFLDLALCLVLEPFRWLFQLVTRWRDRRAELRNSALVRYGHWWW